MTKSGLRQLQSKILNTCGPRRSDVRWRAPPGYQSKKFPLAYLSWLIGNNLVVHPVNLTEEQQSFVGGHLASLEQISSANGCRLTHGWELFSHGGSVTYGP